MKSYRQLRGSIVKNIWLSIGRLPIRNSTLIILFTLLGTLVMLNVFTFIHKLGNVDNEKNKLILNSFTNEDFISKSKMPKKENLPSFDENNILNKILMEGQAFLFEKNELVDNYTRISIDNFGLKENATNPTIMNIKEINLPQSDSTNSLPVIAINDISSINYTFNTEPTLKARCHYEGNKFKNDTINKKNGLFLIFIVISSPKNFEQRKIIRKTWAKHFQTKPRGLTETKNSNILIKENIRVVFLMGLPMKLSLKEMDDDVTDFDTQQRIITENELYKDIVQYNSFDEYYKLTDKSVTMLHWVYTQCPRAKFVIKCDDDVYVNVNNLLSIFHLNNDDNYSIKSSNSRNTINSTAPAVYGSGLQGNINTVQRHPGPF